jgi:phosphatidylglycerophosphatase A
MTPSTENQGGGTAPQEKPRLALAIATALGVGYIPKTPGTFGSLVGIIVAILTHPVSLFVLLTLLLTLSINGHSLSGGIGVDIPPLREKWAFAVLLVPSMLAFLTVSVAGVWSSSRVAAYAGVSDPHYVVIDEVAGMILTLVLGIAPLGPPTHLLPTENASIFALYSGLSLLNWKYLLLGFLLFRLFDIWKPFPVRQLEKLPRGWGIMADDWMAGIYAAILLRVALHFGLLGLV